MGPPTSSQHPVNQFEPAMILLMGVVVLFIVLAILIPIFDMNELV